MDMPYRPIKVEEWLDEYKKGAAAKASKWQSRFLETPGIATAASSPEAQANFEAKMALPEVLKLRQKRLAELSDEDFKAPVRAGGPGIYSTAVSAKAGKAAKRVKPFLDKINEVVPGLAAKTDDVDSNIDNRVKPVSRALRTLKRGS